MNVGEKGFTYPIVIMVVILSCFFLTFQIQFYLSEKQIFHESKTILRQEYLMHTTVKKIETALQNNLLSIGTGHFVFQTGITNYRIEAHTSSLLKITITLKLNSLEEIAGLAYYDKNQKKMVKWLEKN